jgi:hypothetical protein
MTLWWDLLDNGDLALWYWEQDPETDDPLVTQSPDGDGWTWGPDAKGSRDFPSALLDLCFQAAADYHADVQEVDFTLFRFAMEVACEQFERR